MLDNEERDFILNKVSQPVISIAREVNFAARYASMLTRFPKLPGDFNPKVPTERQQELVAQFPYPIRFYTSEGGYYKLNAQKFSYPHMRLMMEMRQWVTFRFNLWREDKRIGGGSYQQIAVAERLARGEEIDWDKDWNVPNSPWCYNEDQLQTALTESFALFDDLCKQLPK
ncbi:hypothetical protein HRJ35_21405 [Shewanella oneidensis MR-1]|uniref:Uncharacterized protein n=2 Tax=Shewanella oneidensis TaxID=70863 RepID=Q8EA71_SHEON|nr:protein of unknown function [Shewanella oneidensis MR-1]MEE2026674.1 hypothetical protein [Shewanella oneidensis]QKG98665.1 hypothetical protein HRJ35_21405 [Shewanella oneidensis MR-1]